MKVTHATFLILFKVTRKNYHTSELINKDYWLHVESHELTSVTLYVLFYSYLNEEIS